jgi:hypothetical protein
MFEDVYTLRVFVHPSEAKALITQINEQGEFYFGKYKNVIWISAEGREEFTPVAGASPTMGQIGSRTSEAAICLEFSLPCDRAIVEQFIKEVILPKHPWEQPVIRIRQELVFITD